MPDDSTRTVLVSPGGGIGAALAKAVTAAFTGSTALAAEACAFTRRYRQRPVPLRGSAAQQPLSRRSASPGYGREAIRELLVTFVGPGRVWIVARVDIDDALRGAQVKTLVRGIESGLKHESETFYRVDVVPIGRAEAVNTETA